MTATKGLKRHQAALLDLAEGMLCDSPTDIGDILVSKLSANDIVKLKSWFGMERDEAARQEWLKQKHRLVQSMADLDR